MRKRARHDGPVRTAAAPGRRRAGRRRRALEYCRRRQAAAQVEEKLQIPRRAGAPAVRAAEVAGVGAPAGAQGLRALRRPRRGRQGRRDQAHHRMPQSARLPHRRTGHAHRARTRRSGTSSATSSNCRRPAKSCSSTAAGTTARASSGSWAFAPTRSTRSSCAPARCSRRCWCARASILIKYWFSVNDEEQERRFAERMRNPIKRWKLSPMDLEARKHWVEYSRAKDVMLEHTDTQAHAVAHRRRRQQEARPPELHHAPAASDPLQGPAGR